MILAEDIAVNQAVAVRMLQRLGFEVVVASHGEQAIAALRAHPEAELVLMDVQMPVMGGFEATRLIREAEQASGRHIPILALTAHALAEDEERCLAAGMDGYIAKPIHLSALAATLKKWLP